ncbi:MAG: sulfotransferase [Luteimonas sp.]
MLASKALNYAHFIISSDGPRSLATHAASNASGRPVQGNQQAGPQLWLEAQKLALSGRLSEAKIACLTLLEHHPQQLMVRLMLASILMAQGEVRAAAEQTKLAASGLPDDADLICRVARCLLALGESNAALACLHHPQVARTNAGPTLLSLAHVFQGLGRHVEALAFMDRARLAGVDSADFRYFRALQLQFNGRMSEAITELEACLDSGPTYGRASLTLARSHRQTATHNHIDFIRARLAAVAKGSEDHASFEFALHKELEDLGDYEEAWRALQRGNAVMHARLPYDATSEQGVFDALKQRFDAPARVCGVSAPDGPIPIFIVGMPRSGTTLLERILGGHSMVASPGELPDFPRQLRWTADLHGHALLDNALLARCSGLDDALLGQRYLEQTRWRAEGRRYYIDKLPPNFMLLGFIRNAIPHAKILHMVRDSMDVCFSNYRAMFGDAYAYSYNEQSLAHHFGLYNGLMRHWHRVMPGFVKDVPYSDLVRNTERVCRDVLAFCGLEFETGCLDTARNEAPVATLSSAQVRESVHTRSLGAWRRYEAQLRPLQRALGAELQRAASAAS